MKAYIRPDGTLVLTPESATEAYAVQVWFDRLPMRDKEVEPWVNPSAIALDNEAIGELSNPAPLD